MSYDMKFETYKAPENHTAFATAGANFAAELATTRKSAIAKDMHDPKNWTAEMIDFYNFIIGKCKANAAKGMNHFFLYCPENLVKNAPYVVDYIRKNNGLTCAKETYSGFESIDSGIYYRFMWE